MPRPSSYRVGVPIAFPAALGEPVWRERRTRPVAALYGVPTATLVVLAFTVSALPARIALATLAIALAALTVRAWRSALIETYTVSESWVAIEQPGGGRAALPTATITGATVKGDSVRIEASVGELELGYVRRRKALIRALERVVPSLSVGIDQAAFCPT